MNRLVVGIALATIAGCGSSKPDVEHATLDRLSFDVRAGWQHRELSDRYTRRVEWRPANPGAAETIVIEHSSPRVAATRATADALEDLLEQAQQLLPRREFGKAVRFRSKRGLVGVRIEGEFVPAGKSEPYRRMHAVLLDGPRFINVLYTARAGDTENFDIVVDSIREGA